MLVLGALGEVVRTREHAEVRRIAGELGVTGRSTEKLLKRCSYSVALVSSKTLLRRAHAASGSTEKSARDPRRERRGREERGSFG